LACRKILVCPDGSALAEAALPYAQMLASDEKAEIILLSIAANPAAEFSFSNPSIANNTIREMEAIAMPFRGLTSAAWWQVHLYFVFSCQREEMFHEYAN